MFALLGIFFQEIIIHMQRKNRQHFRLARSLLHNILIGTHKQEIFPIFMVTNGVHITY